MSWKLIVAWVAGIATVVSGVYVKTWDATVSMALVGAGMWWIGKLQRQAEVAQAPMFPPSDGK